MAFDWEAFCDRYHVYYVTSGPNTARGNISVHCPFCGPEDQSQHMGISLSGKGWGCWRDPKHRGKAPHRLVMALLACSYEQAARIVGYKRDIPEDFLGSVKKLLAGPDAEPTDERVLTLPDEIKSISSKPSAKLYRGYLQRRGYDAPETLSALYDLRYATRGLFAHRIVFPVYEDGELVTMTGRSVYPSVTKRYETLTDDEEKARTLGVAHAKRKTSDCLLWYDDLKEGGHSLVVCEGPFDALRISWLGREYDIHGTCLFTARASERQIDLLHDIAPRFSRRFVMLDPEMYGRALRLASELRALDFEAVRCPESAGDPGGLDARMFGSIFL